MMDKFKNFLAGSPYRMGEDQVDGWAYQVAVILPSVLRKWHDPDFGSDVWAKSGDYYESARRRLVVMEAFNRHCAESGEMLQAMKLLAEFFAEERRKAGLGKTTRKAPKAAAAVRPPVPPTNVTRSVEVLEEGEIKEMHISKHERNAGLRRACIEHYLALRDGHIGCEACGMEFGKIYGDVGDGYIEVHHLNPISQTEGSHVVNPATDLVPLCANCHAMIHRLMAAEKKSSGATLEGTAALTKLREVVEEHRQ